MQMICIKGISYSVRVDGMGGLPAQAKLGKASALT